MPIVKFIKMSKDENINNIKWMFKDDGKDLDVYNYTMEYFPLLAKINKDSSVEEQDKEIEKIVGEYYDLYEEKIDKEVIKYNKIWKEYNDIFFKTLTTYLNIKWTGNDMVVAKVGFMPVSPRYIDELSFSTSVNISDNKIKEIVAHEILHFAWFMKWKEVMPDSERWEWDAPYLAWKYSEMVVDPILNNNEFKEIFNWEERILSYDSFYSLEFNGENIMDKLINIYSSNIDIESKIRNGYKYIIDIGIVD